MEKLSRQVMRRISREEKKDEVEYIQSLTVKPRRGTTRNKRAGFTKNKNVGAKKSLRLMIRKSRKINRK